MSQKFIPSLLIPEVYHPYKRDKNFAANTLEEIVEFDFYRAVELGDGFDKEERKRILEITKKNNIDVIQWFTFLIQENNLDVSSLDSKLRLETVKQIKDNLYYAAEIGAHSIAFVTGDDPGVDRWKDGVEGLYESLCDICEEAEKYNIKVLIEPLDRWAHKKRIIGTTDETVELMLRVKEKYQNIGIAFDTAHAALNEEDILEALVKGQSLIEQIHFSNAVLDKNSELYGDFHMKVGAPGFLTVDKVSEILSKSVELQIKSETGLRIAMEVRGEVDQCKENEATLRAILKEAMNNTTVKL